MGGAWGWEGWNAKTVASDFRSNYAFPVPLSERFN